MKSLQYFSEDYIKACQEAKAEQILKFLDDFRRLNARHFEEQKEELTDKISPAPLEDLRKDLAWEPAR